jgi:hypothetical protein
LSDTEKSVAIAGASDNMTGADLLIDGGFSIR